jgi:hypothetical protein
MRRPRFAQLLPLGLFAAGIPLAGCDDLARLDVDVCGNRVVEDGEDCDGQETCGPPSSLHACRYLCGTDQGGACPTGYACGADAVCRRPKGSFASLLARSTGTALDLVVGDVNADRCADLVISTFDGTLVAGVESRQPGLCAPPDATYAAHPSAGADALSPAPFLLDFGGNGRPELIVPAEGVFGAGLRVYTSDAASRLAPLAFATERFPEPGVRLLKVRAHGKDRLLALAGAAFEAPDDTTTGCSASGGMPPAPPPDSGTIRVLGVESAGEAARELVPALPGGGLNAVAAIAAGDLDGDGCDEVAVTYARSPEIHLYSVCGTGEHLVFSSYAYGGVLTLDGGAGMRQRNASVLFADVNGDGYLDVITNGDDCAAHVAFGGPGHGLGSKPPGPGAQPDAKTSRLSIQSPEDQKMAESPNSVLAAGHFDAQAKQAIVVARDCAPAQRFQSEVCNPIPGNCEVIVADLDMDGLDDVVHTQGQQPGILVDRSDETGMGFHKSNLDTECPPHDLVTGDFDDDGVNDLAFVDQAAVDGLSPHRVLKIAYGRAHAAPEAPRLMALVDGATALVSGSFAQAGVSVPHDQMFMGRGYGDAGGAATSGIGLLTANESTEMLAPLYVPALSADASGQQALTGMSILAAAQGRFAGTKGASREGLAIVAAARASGATPEIWLASLDPGDGHTVATRSPALAGLTCASCVAAGVDVDGDGIDELVLVDDTTLVVLSVVADGFHERTRQTLSASFRAADADANPARHVPRPIVADLDGDGAVDLLLRAGSGAMVALWGRGDGRFDEAALFEAPACSASRCAGQAAARVSLDDSGEARIALVGPGFLRFFALRGRAADELTVDLPGLALPPADTDFVAVGAGDLDGDGVDDLAVMPTGSSVHVFRGIPEHE